MGFSPVDELLRIRKDLDDARERLLVAEERLRIFEAAFGNGAPPNLNTPEAIQLAAASHFDVTREALLGKRRTRTVTKARHVAMYLCRHFLALSYPEIGKKFGRDHSSVINGFHNVANNPELLSVARSIEQEARDNARADRPAAHQNETEGDREGSVSEGERSHQGGHP